MAVVAVVVVLVMIRSRGYGSGGGNSGRSSLHCSGSEHGQDTSRIGNSDNSLESGSCGMLNLYKQS